MERAPYTLKQSHIVATAIIFVALVFFGVYFILDFSSADSEPGFSWIAFYGYIILVPLALTCFVFLLALGGQFFVNAFWRRALWNSLWGVLIFWTVMAFLYVLFRAIQG